MKRNLAALLLALPGLAFAQALLDFRNDLAFSETEVDTLSEQEYRERLRALERTGQLDRDPALLGRLQGILASLRRAAAYERPDSERLAWEVHVCSRCDESASALAGGKLLVSADFVADLSLGDDELAYLVAHEMAHVIAQHTREFATLARAFVGNGFKRSYADIGQQLAEDLSVNLRMQPAAVQQELEADYIGFVLGAHAGIAPEAMLGLLDKLHGSRALLGTHPDDAERLRRARAMLETARILAERARSN
jgi:Zn-dependent protease with chaperone function